MSLRPRRLQTPFPAPRIARRGSLAPCRREVGDAVDAASRLRVLRLVLALALLCAALARAEGPAPAADASAPGEDVGRPETGSTEAESAGDRARAGSTSASYDWTGFYVGGHFGYGFGSAGSFVSDANPQSFTSSFGALNGGVQAGYSYLSRAGLLLGVETDLTFPDFLQDGRMSSTAGSQGSVTGTLDCVGTVRGRVGYGWDRWLLYGSGGFAWSLAHFTDAPGAQSGLNDVVRLSPGWAAGAGIEVALSRGWTVRLEYLYEQFARTSLVFPTGVSAASTVAVQGVELGLNWQIPWPGERTPPAPDEADGPTSPVAAPSEREWSVHGQATFVGQGYPSFPSPYQGANSLSGQSQFANTVSATLFLGLRLWEGGELYFNPELMQGFGLNDVHGLAAFPNGEAQKSDFPIPRFNVARIFLSQTFGLGGEKEGVEDGPNQIAGERDVSRITVTAGKFSTTDFFLLSAYAGGPRTEFLNWNVYGGGSYDQTMDKLSWTWGALVDLNQKHWAVRVGYFLLPVVSNSNSYDTHIPERGQYMAEGEARYSLFSKPGKLLLTAWLSHGNMGSYSASLAQAGGAVPDLALTRQERTNYGFVLGVEQAVAWDLGVFSRLSWSPGQVEIMGWTDCDESFSLGATWKGSLWGRPSDTIGLGGVIEGLSGNARDYFAAGGLGILIGDGRLRYRPEGALEVYYAYSPVRWATATVDYQFVVDPGYNADRGPVSIFSVRLHVEF